MHIEPPVFSAAESSDTPLPHERAGRESDKEHTPDDGGAPSTVANVVTFGCRLNHAESAVIRSFVEGRDDVIVINSCAVTQDAEKSAWREAGKLKRLYPEKKIIMTGCAAQLKPESADGFGGADIALGNAEKLKPEFYTPDGAGLVSDVMAVREAAPHLAESFDGRTRAFLQVQNGCDHRCTFCIIPFARGVSRSVPSGEVVAQARALTEKGYKEIVLTGVDITAYGRDLPGQPTLGMLAARILKLVPELPRLRLSSVDVAEIDSDIVRLLAEEPRFMPYFHLSLQAGDDMILKRMKRRHTRDQILRFCADMRDLRPRVAFGADIIAGFPTETEEMFARTLAVVEEADLQYLHIFPFSARGDTPAAKMPQTPKAIRKRRAAELREAGERNLEKFRAKLIGQDVSILTEEGGKGRTEEFLPVIASGRLPGEIYSATYSAGM